MSLVAEGGSIDEIAARLCLSTHTVRTHIHRTMMAGAEVDVAITWLPMPDTCQLSWQVVATEDRWVRCQPTTT